MSTVALANALTLPPDACLDQQVPKNPLLEQGATAAVNRDRVWLANETKGGSQ